MMVSLINVCGGFEFYTTVVSKFIFMTARGRPQFALHVQALLIVINIYFLLG